MEKSWPGTELYIDMLLVPVRSGKDGDKADSWLAFPYRIFTGQNSGGLGQDPLRLIRRGRLPGGAGRARMERLGEERPSPPPSPRREGAPRRGFPRRRRRREPSGRPSTRCRSCPNSSSGIVYKVVCRAKGGSRNNGGLAMDDKARRFLGRYSSRSPTRRSSSSRSRSGLLILGAVVLLSRPERGSGPSLADGGWPPRRQARISASRAATGAALRELVGMGVKAAGALPALAGIGAALVLLVGVADATRAVDDYVAGRKRVAELTATVRNLERRYKAMEVRIDEARRGGSRRPSPSTITGTRQRGSKTQSIDIAGKELFIDAIVCNFDYSEISRRTRPSTSRYPSRSSATRCPSPRASPSLSSTTRACPSCIADRPDELYGIGPEAYDARLAELMASLRSDEAARGAGNRPQPLRRRRPSRRQDGRCLHVLGRAVRRHHRQGRRFLLRAADGRRRMATALVGANPGRGQGRARSGAIRARRSARRRPARARGGAAGEGQGQRRASRACSPECSGSRNPRSSSFRGRTRGARPFPFPSRRKTN